MDDPSLLPLLNPDNGHDYSITMDDEIEHEEDELDDDVNNAEDEEEQDIVDDEEDIVQNYEQIQQYPEDEIDEDEIEEDEIDDGDNQDEQELALNQPPPPPPQQQTIQSERGGRRKGVPRRLQLSPKEIVKTPALPPQRLLPLSLSKSSSTVHHHDQPILTSDQEDINDISDDFNNENHYDEYYNDKQERNSIQYDLLSKHLIDNDYDENNNNNNDDDNNNVLEIVDDLLADIVSKIVQDIRQERQKKFTIQINHEKINRYSNSTLPTNGLSNSLNKHEQKITNGKHIVNDFIQTSSIKSSKSQSSSSSSKLSDSSKLFNEFTKMMHLNSSQQLVKQKQSSSNSSSPSAKRQKTSEILSPSSLSSLQQQHQQLLWQMTQQLMMSAQPNDLNDSSSLLKQQLLGLAAPGPIPKRVGRPPKQQTQPQIMRSSTNMMPPTTSVNTSSYERTNFAPRRRGRPPKYVTDRSAIPGLPSHDLDPSSYDPLLAAIENSVTGNSTRTSSAAFQSALASMLGHQGSLSIPPPLSSTNPVVRNGAPASMVKQSAGQTRHSLPTPSMATKLSHATNGVDMSLMVAKKRGPGRPPKTQLLIDSHQVLQATKRMNSSLSNNTSNNNNNFPPTMVPSSPNYATFVDLLQQQQHPH